MATQKITAPSGASVSIISAFPGNMLQFDFDTSDATADRTENDLTINFNNGGKVVINDFFVTDGAELPVFALSDGTEVSSSDLLHNMNPDLDLTTAAGPAVSANGSGAGDYGDGAGELLGGVGTLGSLGTFQWNRDTGQSEVEEPLGAFDGTFSPLTPSIPPITPPVSPPVTPPVEPPAEPVNPIYRAVAHTISGSTDPYGPDSPYIRFFIMDGNTNPIDPTNVGVSFQLASGGPSQYFDFTADPIVHSDGSVLYPILESYWEEIKDLRQQLWGQGLYGENGWKEIMGTIMEEVIVSIDGQPSYPMQVVINNKTDYDASDLADTIPEGWKFAGEWHIGGTHKAGLDVAASEGNDSLWFNSLEGGSGGSYEYFLGGGDDTVYIAGSVTSSEPRYESDPDNPDSHFPSDRPSLIFNLGEGNNSFTIDPAEGVALSNGGGLEITAEGNGDNTITLSAIRETTAAKGLFITTGSGNDTVNIQGIRSENYSENIVNLGEGDNSLTFGSHEGFSLQLSNSSSSEVLTGSGSDNVIFTSGIMSASGKLAINTQNGSSISGNDQDYIQFAGNIDGGDITISTGDDTDVIQLDGYLSADMFSVDMGEGDDYIFFNGGISEYSSAPIIDMGEGTDTLVLSANSLQDFIVKYGSWFDDSYSDNSKNHFQEGVNGLEKLHVNVLEGGQEDGEDILKQLQEWTEGMGIDITYGANGENIITPQDILNQFGG